MLARGGQRGGGGSGGGGGGGGTGNSLKFRSVTDSLPIACTRYEVYKPVRWAFQTIKTKQNKQAVK